MSGGSAAEEQGRRLTLAADLSWRARRCASAEEDGEDLPALADRLQAIAADVERAHRVRFDPPYPGASPGVEDVRGGRRLVLTCHAVAGSGAPEAVVHTTLIAGREPLVSVAPYRPELNRATTEGGPWRPV
jgi:hypothetical protein